MGLQLIFRAVGMGVGAFYYVGLDEGQIVKCWGDEEGLGPGTRPEMSRVTMMIAVIGQSVQHATPQIF